MENLTTAEAFSKLRTVIDKALVDYPASSNRAQLLNIDSYKFDIGQSIADRIIADHGNINAAKRAAYLLVDIGGAVEKNNKVFFEDGSSI